MYQSIKPIVSALVIAASTLVGAGGFASSAQADLSAAFQPSALRQADQALAHGEAEQAIEIIGAKRETIFRRHHRAEAAGLVCRAYLQIGEPEHARAACLRALDLEPQPTRWRFLNNLGVAEIELGNYAAAEKAFGKAKQLNRQERVVLKNLEIARVLAERAVKVDREEIVSNVH